MPRKLTFPNMMLYDDTTVPTYQTASYKQRMFTAAIPHDLREACMRKSFRSILMGPTLQWFTKLPKNSISSFTQLTDTFVEQFASSKNSRIFQEISIASNNVAVSHSVTTLDGSTERR